MKIWKTLKNICIYHFFIFIFFFFWFNYITLLLNLIIYIIISLSNDIKNDETYAEVNRRLNEGTWQSDIITFPLTILHKGLNNLCLITNKRQSAGFKQRRNIIPPLKRKIMLILNLCLANNLTLSLNQQMDIILKTTKIK